MKAAFVTGANKGLGSGFVEQLLKKDYRVFGGTRHIGANIQQENLTWIPLELESDASIAQAAKSVLGSVDSIDLLINCAGVNKDTATDGHKEKVSTLKDIERGPLLKMFDVNTIAPLILLKEFLPLLKNDPSFVINISSERASFGDPNQYANYGYRGSKVALNMFTLCSLHGLSKSVRTFAVHPGSVHSDMNPSGTDTPFDQAGKILAITEDWNDELNGKFLNYDGSLYPL
jgi:NAD(P)-dependent dehydrogenase (short-subunit alcohol dehydrogenase family)